MNSQDSQRVGMQELRAIVAVHSGRVEVSGTARMAHNCAWILLYAPRYAAEHNITKEG